MRKNEAAEDRIEGGHIVPAGQENSFNAQDVLQVGNTSFTYFRLDRVPGSQRLPYSLKVLLENLLRTEDGVNVTAEQIQAVAGWNPKAEPSTEIQFTPARV
jgi:aconitate hydratase